MKPKIGLFILIGGGLLAGLGGVRASTPTVHMPLSRHCLMPQSETYTVYIYNPITGNPVLIGSDSYVGGHIFDATDTCIGSVPNLTTDGHIYDANNNCTGFVDPSPAATAEMP